MLRARAYVATFAVSSVLIPAFAPTIARAIPPPEAPRGAPSPGPSFAPVPPGATLPYGSTIQFVLDDKINSATTKPGTIIHMHLRAPLVVNGVTIAPAGTRTTLSIVTTRRAQSGDVDGAVQVHIDSLPLPGRADALPIRAYHEFLTIELTAGQRATRDTTDTLADIFVPYHVIYHAFRRGRQLVLPVGSVLRAQTAATIDARNPKAIVLATPPPFVSTYDVPHADLTPAPFYTALPAPPKPLPKGKPTLPPTPVPTATPTDPPTPAPTTAPTTAPATATP